LCSKLAMCGLALFISGLKTTYLEEARLHLSFSGSLFLDFSEEGVTGTC